MFRHYAVIALAFGLVVLTACSGAEVEQPEFSPFDPRDQAQRERYGTITGGGITLFSTRSPEEASPGAPTGGGGIGVNAYLWRAALETINFIPLASADPFGGLIITDWYQPVETPDERLKLQVLIRDPVLRADGVRVTVLRQVRNGREEWLDSPADPATGRAIEDKILTRARELRVAALEQ
jgi:hypothetical protein